MVIRRVKNTVLRHERQFGTLAGLMTLCLGLWLLSPYFLTLSNFLNVLQQTAINAIIAVGMTYVIISAGIDLSVGSLLAFSGVVLASALQAGVPLPLAILIGLLTGTAGGLINGLLISLGRLPPFISTLGMMSVARGAALVYSDGRPISGFDATFRDLATGKIFYIPVPVVLMVLVYLFSHFLLTRTRFGRYTYAIGGNEEAALLSGVHVKFYKCMVYALSGFMSGLAAIVLTARLNSAQPTAGIMYELDAIAAAVIGGTSLMGGEGTLLGTLIGALIMSVLKNGLNLLGVSSFLQQIVIGSVIIVAVLLDSQLKRSRLNP